MAFAQLFIRMLRPSVAYILLLFAALGAAQDGYRQQLDWRLLGIALVIAAWYVNATTVNDLADFEIDKINLRGVSERPLANGRIGREQIVRLSRGSAAVALVLGFVLDMRVGLLIAICLALNYLYSGTAVKISHRGALAPLLLPIGYVVLPYLVGVWSLDETITHKGWLILIALYISFIGRIILKDFRDVKGDAAFGKLTFILRYGRKATCITSAVCLLAGNAVLLAVLPRQPLIIASFEVLLVCMLFGLYKLYAARNLRQELAIIAAVVKAASGAVVMLLALLLLQNGGQPESKQIAVTAALGALFLALFADNLSNVPTARKAHKT